MKKTNLLVVGARRDSLGWWAASLAKDIGWSVLTAGKGIEDLFFSWPIQTVEYLFTKVRPTNLLVTVGVNLPTDLYNPQWNDEISHEFLTNAYLPLALLRHWAVWSEGEGHGVAISSNSAQIPRSDSVGYCASKAALSQGVRTLARTAAKKDLPSTIYAYEPGYIEDTPMSRKLDDHFNSLHRIPGGRSLHPGDLASLIIANMANEYRWLNGTILRLDGGEI